MQEISREEYISRINPQENCYLNLNLIYCSEDKIYLIADIEDKGNLRIEMMKFKMDTSLNFLEANSECRGRYSGGIYFIEYDSEEETEKNIIKDFMDIETYVEIIYLLCKEDDLKNILPKYKNKIIYVMTDFEIKKTQKISMCGSSWS